MLDLGGVPLLEMVDKGNSTTLDQGVYIIGHSYAGYVVVALSNSQGAIVIGGTSLDTLSVTITQNISQGNAFTLTYGSAGSGSSRYIYKLFKL